MKLNLKLKSLFTHEKGKASFARPEQQLRRSVMACLLWEDQFYEDGIQIAERIQGLIPLVNPEVVAALAIEAREQMKLRHVPLLLVRDMARLPTHRGLVAKTLERVIQRADELAEFMAIYWKDQKQPLSAQVKKGLALAFQKFDAYQLSKYNRDGALKLRDVLFLSHAKPKDLAQESVWKKLVQGSLEAPDTWEVALSRGEDKKEVWERLLRERKLGALALLRNLRNMAEAQVSEALVLQALTTMKSEKVLPFRFLAAAREAPQWEPEIEEAMLQSLAGQSLIQGRTGLLVDVSGSMDHGLSGRSTMKRVDAAGGLAILLREICENLEIFTFSEDIVRVPTRRGFALMDAIIHSQNHRGTYLGRAVNELNHRDYDRLIVVTDEQSHDAVASPNKCGYIINVASYKNGVGYGPWTHIDGWSESVIRYIKECEITQEN